MVISWKKVIATQLKVDVFVRIALVDPDQGTPFLLNVIYLDSSYADHDRKKLDILAQKKIYVVSLLLAKSTTKHLWAGKMR